ncbi:MAG: hypothetical protein RDU20_08585 [Desulfomonilaceae bacterium]|nr:hypothetical protein [Desulfomonilaceae bacterium]
MGFLLIKKLRDVFLVIFSLTVVLACSSSAPFKQSDLETVMEEMERKAYLVRQFTVQFVKTRSSPIFEKELKVDGRLVFQKLSKTWLTLKGDVNVEVLSDGRFIKIVHDDTDEEIFSVRGHRDMTRFADPLMILIDSLGNGGLRDLAIVQTVRNHDSRMVEIDPSKENRMERIERVFLWLSHYGEIERVRILFKDGGTDDTVFKSWSVLSEDAPEIGELNHRLKTVSVIRGPGIRGDGENTMQALAREDPFAEPLALHKPITVDDFGLNVGTGVLTLP